jgi:hypothetical protein
MTRLWLSLLPVFLVLACGSGGGDEALIRRSEAKLALPLNADPMSRYDRYYAISGRTAVGTFIWSETGRGKVTIVATEKDLPFVADGGCGVIHVRLDLEKEVWERPYCNGQI